MGALGGVSRFSDFQWSQILSKETCLYYGLWPRPEDSPLVAEVVERILGRYREAQDDVIQDDSEFPRWFHERCMHKKSGDYWRIGPGSQWFGIRTFQMRKHELGNLESQIDCASKIGCSTIAVYRPLEGAARPAEDSFCSFKLSFYASNESKVEILNNLSLDQIRKEEEFVNWVKSRDCKLLEEFVFSIYTSSASSSSSWV